MNRFKDITLIVKGRTLYLLILLIFLLPRVFNLGTDISNSDALRWHHRSENFLRAIGRLDFNQTYQMYHPGVTLMWIGSTASAVLRIGQTLTHTEVRTLENADFYPIIHGFSKLLLVLVLACCLALQLYLIQNLYGRKISIIYGVLISLEPYFIGINRWFHLSSMEAFFAITSFLSLVYYFKSSQKKYLYISALLVGLGILTKTTVLVTLLFNAFLLITSVLRKKERIQNVLWYILATFLTILILFPALWTNSSVVISNVYASLVNSVSVDNRVATLSFLQQFFYYPIILFFKMSPLMVVVLITALIYGIYEKLFLLSNWARDKNLVCLYVLFLVIFLTVSDQKIDRYSIALFMPLILIAAFFLSRLKNTFIVLLLAVHILFFGYTAYIYYPVYSAYISPIVSYDTVLKQGFYDNSGEYYSQAALYLNTKGRYIFTYLPNNVASFYPYYKGKKSDSELNANYIVYGLDFDRKSFVTFPNCAVEKYFGNKLYKPVVVYRCNL